MSDERFARQYRYGPPPEFPLASSYSDIVHHLSGPNTYAHTQTFLRKSKSAVGAEIPTVTFISHMRMMPMYSRMCVDSLVRVSRRVNLDLLRQHRGSRVPCNNSLGASRTNAKPALPEMY